jgi:hypothetical protein
MCNLNTVSTAPTSKSRSFCISSSSEVPLRCFHVRLLHSKCCHISNLECHEQSCSITHVGWVLEETPSGASSNCFEIKHYLRIKDEHCKFCQSYLNPSLTTTVSAMEGWFSRAEKRVNPKALPQEFVDAVLDGWRIQVGHMKQERAKLGKEQREKERKHACVTSAAVRVLGESSEANAGETVISVESDDERLGSGAKKLC